MADSALAALIAAAVAQLEARDDFDRYLHHGNRTSAKYEIACVALEDAVRAFIKTRREGAWKELFDV